MKLQLLLDEINMGNKCGNSPYTIELLTQWISEILELLQELMADKFASNAIIRLNEGKMQVICCYKRIISIDRQTNYDGSWTHEFKSKQDLKVKLRFTKAGWKAKCSAMSSSDKDSQFYIDEVIRMSDTLYEVSPPIPSAPPVYVLATVIKKLDDTIEDGEYPVPGWAEAAVHQWVMYCAAMMGGGDPESVAVANIYKNTFVELLGLDLKIIELELERKKNSNVAAK